MLALHTNLGVTHAALGPVGVFLIVMLLAWRASAVAADGDSWPVYGKNQRHTSAIPARR